MAKFTAPIPLNIRLPGGFEVSGAVGVTHRIPDALVEEFIRDTVPAIPGGVTWITQDETSNIPSLPITEANVTGLVADLAAKFPTAGGTISGAVTVTGALNAQSVGLVIYADQYSSLQAAIDAAPTSGATIMVPRATYTLSTPLILKSNLTLRGQGMASVVVANTAISIARGTSVSDVTIENLYIDGGQSTTGGNADDDAIEAWTGCNRWTIRNCYITRSARDGIGLRSGAGHLVQGNTIVSTREDGITLNGITDTRVIGNFLSAIGGDAILLKSVRRTVVQGNTIVSPGVAASGAGISVGADSATFNEYISVIGNAVLSASGASIYCAFSSYCTFQGNTLKSGGSYGLWFDSSQDCIFSGNVIDGMTGHGLRVVSTATRLTASGNIIQNVGTANNGIESAVGAGHRYTGNQFSGTMNRGINCSSSSTVISSNHFSALVGAAVRVAGSDVVVSANEAFGCGESGSLWITGARVNVNGNLVAGATGHAILLTSGADDGVIVGNILVNAASTKDGIRIDNCLNVVVAGNRASGATQEHGLHSTGTADGLAIHGNQFSGNVTANLLIVGTANQLDVPSGSAFPTSPATNQRFYRTDRNLEYFYDGTRWLTTTLYQVPVSNTDALQPLSATTTPFGRVVGAQTSAYDAYIVEFRFSSFIATTNTSAAFWTFTLRDSAGTTIATATTSADAANAWVSHVVSVNALLGTTKIEMDVVATKTSTPGNANVVPSVVFRLVG